MPRSHFLALAALGLAVSTGAQTATNGQHNAGVQAQANASASASANASGEGSKSQNSTTAGSSSSAASSTSVSASGNPASVSLSKDTSVNATLLTTLDARHSKPGDRVEAQVAQDVRQDGHVVLKKGSHLTGHVTSAQERSKDHAESSLGVVFDHALMKGGQEMPMNLSIQALAAAASQSSASLGEDEGMVASSGSLASSGGAGARGGLLGSAGGAVSGASGVAGGIAGNAGQAVNGTAGAATHSVTSTAGSAGGLNAAGQLTSGSSGVFGLQGLNLTSAASNGTQASVVNSTSRNVHLDSGTQMMLQAVNQ